MSRRTQIFQKIPWSGGVNTSVDPGMIPSGDLVQADNVVFTTTGTRKKREGFDYFDTAIPAVIKRSSSGTTRTLQFAASVSIASPLDQILVVGEQIKIAGAGDSHYNNAATATVASITTTDITNDTITYTFTGATSLTESLTADTSAVVSKRATVLGVFDYWYYDSSNGAKSQYRMAATSQGLLFRYDTNGRRKQIVASGSDATALAITPLTHVDMRTYNNKLIWAMSGVGNTPKYYDPTVADEWKDLPGAPDGQYLQEHLGRLWMDDKTTLDRVHFCETFDETLWLGLGDSGALDLGIGDGDPVGISALMPPFRGVFFVAKGTKLFRIDGEEPETFQVNALTNGVGALAHKAAVSFDMDDVFYVSKRGVHSINTTQQFGDFSGRFLSQKIQPTFNTWDQGALKNTQAAYLTTINSIAFTVAEDGHNSASSLWLYNPTVQDDDGIQGAWYRWPNLDAQCVCAVLEDDDVRILCGTSDGRLIIGQNGTATDFEDQNLPFRIKSGAIYPDGNPQSIKGFKKFGLLFKPRGRYAFTAYFKVDNLPAQAFSFEQDSSGDKLGVDFILGSSLLGSNKVLTPFTKNVTGFGRGCSIEIFQSGTAAEVEIYGYFIEYESADLGDEAPTETDEES